MGAERGADMIKKSSPISVRIFLVLELNTSLLERAIGFQTDWFWFVSFLLMFCRIWSGELGLGRSFSLALAELAPGFRAAQEMDGRADDGDTADDGSPDDALVCGLVFGARTHLPQTILAGVNLAVHVLGLLVVHEAEDGSEDADSTDGPKRALAGARGGGVGVGGGVGSGHDVLLYGGKIGFGLCARFCAIVWGIGFGASP